MRFYANENFPGPAVTRLRHLGHDVLTTLEAGQANLKIPDADVVQFAAGQRRVVLTLNRRDFVALHDGDANHAGIVVCHEDLDFMRLANRIHAEVYGRDLDRQLVRLPKP
jgi:hypothetical protein